VSEALDPGAPHDLPGFITAPGDTDILMVVVGIVLIGAVLGGGRIVNACTSNHDLIAAQETGAFKAFVLHAVGIVHAMLLRIQALMFPIKTLVLSGH
jgi:hypothetical protein